MIDLGQGAPIVLIPGIQGRWEWMWPAVEALSLDRRVLSFSLAEAGRWDDFWESYIDDLLQRSGIQEAMFAGVSFGGLIAARYAARNPERVRALVLVSTPSPRWPLDERNVSYLRRGPVRSAPAFLSRALGRLTPEVTAVHPNWIARVGFLLRYCTRAVRFPPSPRRMASWVAAWQALDIAADCRRISVPTLLITGEASLDRVVPQASTLDYLSLIPGARHVTIPHSGHIGLVTRPKEFARFVGEFSDASVAARKPSALTCI